MPESNEPRWLTPEQSKAWVSLVHATTRLPAALDAQLQHDAAISFVEYQMLAWLSMVPGQIARMSNLAARANMSLSHLSRVVTRLEKRGWVTRSPDPADGRATLAVLTEAGWNTVLATAPGHVHEVKRLVFDNLTHAQVGHLHRIGEHIVDAIGPGVPG